ncbi:hypothetical protein EEL30_22110 [Brevibacillus laterosporus]|uniref:GIY-YIG domain-containing protein n=1 Tax=Brevibacillus laterosporus TaxID=1465 RepID=A0A518VCR6_BRELA|nr:hypothetical protein EEL30_22110 [Brevibacillus laterosporus]
MISNAKICGIYIIKNILNHHVYIGQSVNIHQRFREHKSRLRNNKHGNGRLQNAWNKYGEEKFIFKVLETVEIDNLDYKEIQWIKYYKSSHRDYGYNIEYGGNCMKQVPDETKRKISKNHADSSGKNNPFFGRKHTKESIEKIRSRNYAVGESHAGAVLTDQDVKKIKKLLAESKMKVVQIASMSNVKAACISKIKHGKTWSHL